MSTQLSSKLTQLSSNHIQHHPDLLNTVKRVNNIHRVTIRQHIQDLENALVSSSVYNPARFHNPADIFTWLALIVFTLIHAQNNNNVRYFNKLGNDEYMYILECSKLVADLNASSEHNVIACIYLVNSLLPWVSKLLDNKLVLDVQDYISGLLDENSIISGLLVFYTNIRKLEFLTNTAYTGQYKSIYRCLYKLQCESTVDIVLEELSSNKLLAGLPDKAQSVGQFLGIDIHAFNKMFRLRNRNRNINLNISVSVDLDIPDNIPDVFEDDNAVVYPDDLELDVLRMSPIEDN